MDQGLRVTVGNDMYYDNTQPRHERDFRNRFGSRPDSGRFEDQRDDHYRRPAQHHQETRSWGHGQDWSQHPSEQSPTRFPSRLPDRFSPPNRYESGHRSPSRGYRPPNWSTSGEQIRYDPDVHRPRAERSRSPSYNRSRSPYRKGSPTPYSHMRQRTHSRSPSPNRKQSLSHPHENNYRRGPTSEDLLSSMYSDSSAKVRSEPQSRGALDSLRETYQYERGDPRKEFFDKKSTRKGTEEEEAFLYGDDSKNGHNRKETRSKDYFSSPGVTVEPVKTAPKPVEKQAVTPGGFDTNALKNVLKAIGFDFELSAQSVQNAVSSKDSAKTTAKPPEEKKSNKKADTVKEINPSVSSATPSEVVFQNPFPQALGVSPSQYIPQNLISGQDPNFLYNQAALQYSASMGVPATLPQQMLYQAGLPQNAVLPFMQAPIPVNVPDRPNLKVINTDVKPADSQQDTTKVSKTKSSKSLAAEKKVRKKRLDYLEVELKNLKKKQAELVRKKKKQMNATDREQIRENTMLQAGVEKQIQQIREAAERAAGIGSSSESSDSDESSEASTSSEEQNYNYVDSGSHFCRDCNITCGTLTDFLNHLHSKGHKKLMDPDYRPWYKKISFKTKPDAVPTPLKGAQFLLPVHGYFCKLCKLYAGDAIAADEHCRTKMHNLKYAKFCKKNPDYEKQLRSTDIQNVADRIKKLKEEQKDKIKEYPKQYAAVEPKKAKPVQKEEKYYDKPEHYPDPHKRPKPKEKHYEDKKDYRYSKPSYEPDGHYKKYDSGSSSYSKPRFYDNYHSEDVSRPSSRMSDRSQDSRSRDFNKPYDKGFPKRDGSYKGSTSHSPPRRSRSPRERDGSDYFGPAAMDKRHDHRSRFDDQARKIEEKKKRKSRGWSPGYDEFEKREENEPPLKYEKKPKSPDRSFGKFTWKKTDKVKVVKKPNQPTESDDKANDNKFSLKIETKSNNGGRMLRPRAKFGHFAPHTKVVPSQKNDDKGPKNPSYQRPTTTTGPNRVWRKNAPVKKPLQPVPPPEASKPEAAYKSSVVEAKKPSEPPPPGTVDIFSPAGASDHDSDASGISMELGSDIDP